MSPNGTAWDMRPSNKYFNFLAFLLDLTPFCVKLLIELMWFSLLMNWLKLISDLSSAIKEERQQHKKERERERTDIRVVGLCCGCSRHYRPSFGVVIEHVPIKVISCERHVAMQSCALVVNAQTALAVSLGIGNLLPIKTGCSAANALATLLQDSRCTSIQASAAFASFLSLR